MGNTENIFLHPLVLDVSSPVIQVGIADQNNWKKIISRESNALDGVFQSVTSLTDELKIKFEQIDAVFFCSGPGSTLGLRLALAFVKTLNWEMQNKISLFSYNALDLANRMVSNTESHIQAPFRMGWRIIRIKSEGLPIGKKEILENKEALKRFPDSMHLPDSRKQSDPINPQKMIDYNLEDVRGLYDLTPISEKKEELEIYNPKPPEFKKWEPKIKFLNP